MIMTELMTAVDTTQKKLNCTTGKKKAELSLSYIKNTGDSSWRCTAVNELKHYVGYSNNV